MKIVRLECTDGNGPWRTDWGAGLTDVFQKTFKRHSTANKKGMPLPCRDGIGDMDDDDLCAYHSLEDMKKWVYLGELSNAIIKHDLRVLLLDVMKVKKGINQVVYKRKWIISKEDISEMFIKGKKKNEKVKENWLTVADDGDDPHFGSPYFML